ncbi:hypothetical protein HYW74_00940 [Candidatus Pacearchaeota archaeon]|nr:hypothetical protein [Candidatus Pacearchaeota archaeon]
MTIERIEGVSRVSGLSPLDKAYVIPRDVRVHELENTRLMGNLPKYVPEYRSMVTEREDLERNVLDVKA